MFFAYLFSFIFCLIVYQVICITLFIVDTNEFLGFHLLQFGTNLSRLSAYFDIKKGILFSNFNIAVHYCIEYGRFKGFTVRKKRMDKNLDKNSDESIHSRCLDCEYSGKIPNNNGCIIRNKSTKKTQY